MLLEDADPYPWPYDGDLCGGNVALVVVGPQAHWMGRSTDTNRVCANIQAIAAAITALGGRVVIVRHGHLRATSGGRPGRLALPVEGSPAWKIDLAVAPGAQVVDAAGFDGFYGSALDAMLRSEGRTHLVVVGFAAEVCVDCTLRSANDQGYECVVVADACAPIDPDTGARALSSVTMSGGIFGAVCTTASLCAAIDSAGRSSLETVT